MARVILTRDIRPWYFKDPHSCGACGTVFELEADDAYEIKVPWFPLAAERCVTSCPVCGARVETRDWTECRG